MFGKQVGRLGIVPRSPLQRAISALKAIYATGVQGVWYDPSDFTTLFQDSAGTTPVTAVEQSVGRMLDKSGRGNHATQPTAINRPVLSARVNLLTETEFRNGVTDAPTRGGLVSATTLTGYLGAIAFGHDGVQTSFAYKAPFTAIIGQAYTISVIVAMTDGLAPVFGSSIESSALNVFALVLAGDAQNPTSYTVTNLGGGLYRVSGTRTATTASANFGVVKYSTNNSRTFKVTAYQLETGSVATRYQRINTSTDYDTVGFKHYLKCNGTNSSMSTGSIDFTGTDKMMVCAGVRKLSDAGTGVIVELSTNLNSSNGSMYLLAPVSSGIGGYAFVSKGSVQSGSPNAAMDAPTTKIICGIGDISGDLATLRINGAQVVQSTSDQGTGNFGNYPLYIGARAGTSLFFNGNIYGLIIAGTAATPAQIAAAELLTNSKTGAY